jgi:membrane fusion protein, adhesin transport system
MKPKDRKAGSLGQTLTLPLGLVNNGKLHFFRSLTYICCGLVLAIAAWSAVAEFREVAVARGQIVPSNATQKIHHLEGGILDAVLVAEGDEVEKGQPLLRLRPEASQNDLEQMEARLNSLRVQHARLQSLLTGEMPDFSVFGGDYPDIHKEQLDFHANTLNKDARDREKIELEIKQSEAELSATTVERESLSRRVTIETEKVDMRRRTFEMGHTSRIVYLEATSQMEAVQQKLATADGKVVLLRGKVQEGRQALQKSEAERTHKLAEESAKVTSELLETENAVKKHRDRVLRLTILSPAKGIVQLLVQRNAGEVIKPGDLVAEIISLQSDVIAEVQLLAKDIGNVKLDAPARIKASNYDPTGIEIATGRVVDISATTFETKDGQPYYRTRIKLDSLYVGRPERNWRLLPGMVVEADIVTGSKPLLKYMLKPVYRSLDSAFSER